MGNKSDSPISSTPPAAARRTVFFSSFCAPRSVKVIKRQNAIDTAAHAAASPTSLTNDKALYAGNWEEGYDSQSDADMAFV